MKEKTRKKSYTATLFNKLTMLITQLTQGDIVKFKETIKYHCCNNGLANWFTL